AMAGEEGGGCESRESILHFCRKMIGHPCQRGEEAGSSIVHRTGWVLRDGAKLGKRWGSRRCGVIMESLQQPLTLLPREETDRRHTRWDDPTYSIRLHTLRKTWMRRQPAPTDRSAQAEPVQELRLIFGQAKAQELRFPGGCCGLESRKLLHHFQKARFSMLTRSRCDVLPLQQKPHELGCRHRLHFFP